MKDLDDLMEWMTAAMTDDDRVSEDELRAFVEAALANEMQDE